MKGDCVCMYAYICIKAYVKHKNMWLSFQGGQCEDSSGSNTLGCMFLFCNFVILLTILTVF